MPQQPRDPLLDILAEVQAPRTIPAMGWATGPGGEPIPLDDDAPDPLLSLLDEVQGASADDRSMFARAFDTVFTPPEVVTQAAASVADRMDPALTAAEAEELNNAPHLFGVPLSPRAARSYYAGAVEGLGSLLTPGDALLTALGLRAAKPLLAGVRGGARVADAVNRGANIATTARGVERLADAESVSDAAAGVAQTALGAAGTMTPSSRPQDVPRPRAALPPGASYVVAPDGRVAPAGTDIPMTAAPDGSFVRGVPAEYARHEIAGLLPPGREPIITPPPPGSVPSTADPSFVRGVPAELARREIRGELPPGPRFHADAAGNVAPAERVDELLQLLDEVQGRRGPDPSGVRSSRPAVLDRDVDAAVPAREGVRVRQYAGDPNAIDAPFLDAEDLQLLERAGEDLAVFTPQQGRLIRDPNDPNADIYARGGRGSYIAEDVRIISEQNVSNAEVEAARQHLVNGGTPTNRLHTAWLDWARGVRAGDEGYHRPTVPDTEVTPRGDLPAAAGGEVSRGGAPVEADDFAAFSRMFDDVEPGTVGRGREPGEEGFITSQLATHLGAGAAGAATGAATGEDTEDRIRRGLLFGAAGAVAPALLRRGGTPRAGFSNAPRLVVGPSPARTSRTPRAGQGPQLAPAVVAEAVSRVPRTGRSGDPIENPLEGFEPFLNAFRNPLVREGVAGVIRDNGGFTAQRRGRINQQQLGQFANEVRVNVDRALPRGTALTAEGITAYGRALQETTRRVQDFSERINAGTATDADVVAFEAARAEQAVVAQSLIGARREAGAALGAFNLLRGTLETGNVELIRDAATRLREEAARIAQGLAGLPDDPLTRYRWLQAQQRTPWSTHLRSYYLSNLLSGPLTHARNILGNLSNLVVETATLPVAAGIDAARSAIRGTPRTVRLSELPARASGALVGVERGLQDALFALRHGIHPATLARTVDTAATRGRVDLPPVELPGGGANPLNYPFRALQAPDALFRSVNYESELASILFNQARTEGRSGEALLARVAELRGAMTPEAIALREQAQRFAARAVFLEEPGDITRRVVLLAESVPGSWFVLPFIRITSAIARQGAEFSPVGFLMQAAQREGRAGTQAQARATAGTMAAGYLFWLASTGRLSGNGPSDPAERAALMESGWRPNSVKVGERWYGYQTISPLNVPAAVIANSVEAWRDRGEKPQDVPDVLAQVFARTANSFLESTFLEGTFNLVEAMKDPERNAARFFGRTASGLIPGSSALRTVQRVTDPTIRQPRTFTEHLTAGLPGLSEEIEPRIDRFGQPVVREGGAAQRALDVFNSATEVNDHVAQELDRLGVKLTLPSPRVGGQQLTREQETEVRQRRGRAVRQALERLVASPGYQRMSDTLKAQVLEKTIERARAQESRALRGGPRGIVGQSTPSQKPSVFEQMQGRK